MNKPFYLSVKAFILFAFLFLISCETEDILPVLDVSKSSENLSEASGNVVLTAQLNGPASERFVISYTTSGSAVIGQDYLASQDAFVFEKGATESIITLTGVQNEAVEGTKSIIIAIAPSNNVLMISAINLTINLLDDDADTDGDGIPDALDECPEVPGPIENNGCPFLGLLINEVLYDPADGIAGDANNDGTRHPLEDEFVELFNSNLPLDISGYTLSDADMVRHVFPSGTIIPQNGVIVVFGGGTPTGSFGGSIVQTASNGQLNLNNAGDILTLRDASGNVIEVFDITPLSGNPNESYSRFPDVTGAFARHSTIPVANGAIHSPGVKVNGTNF
jgi:hypothetical protein